MQTKRTSFLVLLLQILITVPLLAQVSRVTPETIHPGDEITIAYSPAADSVLSGTDELYVTLSLHFTDHGTATVTKALTRNGNSFDCAYRIPEKLASADLNFISRNNWDQKAARTVYVLRPDGSPMRTVEQMRTLSSGPADFESHFKKELSLYPNNYAAYQAKWSMLWKFHRSDFPVEAVSQEIEKLEREVSDKPAGLLYALSYGHLLLKDEARARTYLQELLQRFPNSPLIKDAYTGYIIQTTLQKLPGRTEVQKMVMDFMAKHPEAPATWEIISRYFPIESTPPYAEPVLRKLITDQPDNPEAYYRLAGILWKKKQQDPKEALELAGRAANLMFKGEMRLHGDLAGLKTMLYLPKVFQFQARLALEQGNDALCLEAASVAERLALHTDPGLFELQAQAWERGSHFEKAEKAWLRALNAGSGKARKRLEALYKRRHGDLSGFDLHLETMRANLDTSGPSPARDFDAVTLKGKHVSLKALQGRIVVLNFWFINCAPCLQEMPGLNQLVDEFRGKDVVFLSFALDSEKALRQFLKDHEFKYQVVPNAAKIASSYGVREYPTHIIINAMGHVELSLAGGGKNGKNKLKPVLERLVGSKQIRVFRRPS